MKNMFHNIPAYFAILLCLMIRVQGQETKDEDKELLVRLPDLKERISGLVNEAMKMSSAGAKAMFLEHAYVALDLSLKEQIENLNGQDPSQKGAFESFQFAVRHSNDEALLNLLLKWVDFSMAVSKISPGSEGVSRPERSSIVAMSIISERNKHQIQRAILKFVSEGKMKAYKDDNAKIILARLWILCEAGQPIWGPFLARHKVAISKNDAIEPLKTDMERFSADTPEGQSVRANYIEFIDAIRRAPFPEGVDEREISTQPLKKE